MMKEKRKGGEDAAVATKHPAKRSRDCRDNDSARGTFFTEGNDNDATSRLACRVSAHYKKPFSPRTEIGRTGRSSVEAKVSITNPPSFEVVIRTKNVTLARSSR